MNIHELKLSEDIRRSVKRFAPLMLIAVACLAVYGKTIFFGYVHYDDARLILDNQAHFESLRSIGDIFTHNVYFENNRFYYRPLFTATLLIESKIWGIAPLPHHAVNVFLHLAMCGAVYMLLQLMGYRRSLSLAWSLIFAVHPLFTDAVAWIPGRNDELLGLFITWSFIFFIRFLRSGNWSEGLLHLMFFTGALFSKETAIVFPVLCMLYAHRIEKKSVFIRRNASLLAGWVFIVMIFFILWTRLDRGGYTAFYQLLMVAGDNLSVIIKYAGAIFFPFHLQLLPLREDMSFVPGLIATLLSSLLLWFAPRKDPARIAFGVLWILAFVIPTLIIAKAVYQGHRMYVPMIGMFIILSELRGYGVRWKGLAQWFPGSATILIIVLASSAFMRNNQYISQVSYWQKAAQDSPRHSEVRNRLGLGLLRERGLAGRAEIEFRNAIVFNPDHIPAYRNLAILYYRERQYTQTITVLHEAIARSPRDSTLYNLMGISYASMFSFDKALDCLRTAVRLDPKNQMALKNISLVTVNRANNRNANTPYRGEKSLTEPSVPQKVPGG